MGSFRVVKEHSEHFEAEGAGGPFRIGKRGLSPARVASFQAMCSGGTVQALAEGGEVKPKAEPVAKPKEQGMDLSRVRLMKEDDKAWHLSDDRGDFRVLKAGVSKGTAAKIAKFCKGGQVQHLEGGGDVLPIDVTLPPDASAAQVAAQSAAVQQQAAEAPQNTGAVPSVPTQANGLPIDVTGAGGITPQDLNPGQQGPLGIESAPATPSGPSYFPDAMARVDTTPIAASPQAPAPSGATAAPAVPKIPGIGAPPGMNPDTNGMTDAYAKARVAEQAKADVAKKMATDQVAQEQANERVHATAMDEATRVYNEGMQRGQQLRQQVMDQTIDPNHYWASKGTGGKISAAIGLILGGIGSGLTKTPNAALGVIQNAIDRDIDAQKSELGKKEWAYNANAQDVQSQQAFWLNRKADLLAIAKGKLDMIATKYSGQAAQATADATSALLSKEEAANRQQAAAIRFNQSVQAQQSAMQRAMFPLQYQQAAQGVEQGALGLNMTRAQYGALGQILDASAGGGGRGGGFDPRILEMPGMEKYRERAVTLPDGSTALARTPEDKKNLDKTLDGAATLRSKLQRYGALLAAHPHGISSTLSPEDYAQAQALRESMLTDINSLAGLNRFTSEEAKVYGGRIPDITSKGRASSFRAPLTELGREIDEKLWHGVRQSLSVPNTRPMPGSR